MVIILVTDYMKTGLCNQTPKIRDMPESKCLVQKGNDVYYEGSKGNTYEMEEKNIYFSAFTRSYIVGYLYCM